MNNQLIKRAIEIASEYRGKTEESGNRAPWLDELMARGGNPSGWQPGEPYAFAALMAVYQAAAKDCGTPATFPSDYDSRIDDADAIEPGMIVTFTVPGYDDSLLYGLVVDVHPGVAVRTIEFNTRPGYGGPQHAGEGCFQKYRAFTHINIQAIAWPHLGEHAHSAVDVQMPSSLNSPLGGLITDEFIPKESFAPHSMEDESETSSKFE